MLLLRLQLNEWFLKSRDPETGAFPDLPDAAKGGSKSIIHPAPPQPAPEETAALAALKDKEAKAKSGKGKGKGARAGKLAELQGAPWTDARG